MSFDKASVEHLDFSVCFNNGSVDSCIHGYICRHSTNNQLNNRSDKDNVIKNYRIVT